MTKRFKFITISLLVICSVAFAYELQSYYIMKFLGINNRINPRLLKDDESPDMSNFDLEETGSLQERVVFGKYNTAVGEIGTNPVTGLFKFYPPNAKYFVTCAGSKIISGAGGLFSTDITNAAISITAGSFWSAETFNDFLYLFNQTVAMQKWTGTGATTTPAGTPSTNCAYGAVHKNRMWAGGSASQPQRLYFSSIDDGDDWTTTGGFADLPDLISTITGLKTWGPYLYVFTETNIYILQGSTPNNFSLTKSTSDVGAIAPRSIRVTDQGIIFLARTGVFIFNGSRSYKLSDKIEPTINAISVVNIKNACGLWDGQSHYWLSYCERTSSINNEILVYNTLLKEWYAYDNLNINYFARAYGGTDKGELYGGTSTSDGAVWLLQEASGTESICHTNATQFKTGATFNTTLWGTEAVPIIQLGSYEYKSDTNTTLLSHVNGADTATSTPDSSPYNHTITFAGNAELDTAEFRRGVSSCDFDGTNSYLQLADSPAWDIVASSSDDWTIDFWVKHNVVNTSQMYISQYVDATHYFLFRMDGVTSGIHFKFVDGSGDKADMSGTKITDTDWHHIALIKVASAYGIYLDGTQINYASETSTGNFTAPLTIGSRSDGLWYLNGNMDEIRIQHSNAFGAKPNTGKTDTITYGITGPANGNIVSTALEINASGQASLGEISWTESLDTYTDIQLTTRTGATGDTAFYNGWETWTSTSTVIEATTDATAWTSTSNIDVSQPTVNQVRNILTYETDDDTSPNCVRFVVNGALSTNESSYKLLTTKDLTDYKWLGYWLKSPQTGNTVKLTIYDSTGSAVGYSTGSTVVIDTWEKQYWTIDNISTKTDVSKLQVEYLGDTAGDVILSDVYAYDFYDSGDTITSTANDYVQYRAILGTKEITTPLLYTVSLEYTPAAGEEEASLSSYYKTRFIDFGTPYKNKQFMDLFVEYETDGTGTLYVDYDIDDGVKDGTLTYTMSTTGSTVRKVKHFSGSTYGKVMQLNFRNTDKDSRVTIRACEVRYRQEGGNTND